MPQRSTDRARGVLLGLACGDALGRPVEFKSATAIEREHGELREMIGHGTWGQPAGTITDDTELALCIARSLAEQGRFDPADISDRFVQWYESGPFDIGGMTRKSITRLQAGDPWDEAGQTVWENAAEGSNAGNGSVMRCPPLALAYADYPGALVRASLDSSLITHADPRCTYGCAVLNLTIAACLDNVDEPLTTALNVLADDLPTSMHETIGVIPDGASTILDGGLPSTLREALASVPADIDDTALETTPYVVTTLQTALHDALTAESVEEAIIRSVNRGGDTDTIAAIAGAVAGARFGATKLPSAWLDQLDSRAELDHLAETLTTHPWA